MYYLTRKGSGEEVARFGTWEHAILLGELLAKDQQAEFEIKENGTGRLLARILANGTSEVFN